MKQLYDKVSTEVSRMVTQRYSTSFSIGILFLDKKIRPHIYAIYGFVRLADEIVDTFHDYNKKELLEEFERDTYKAIQQGISLNPVLNSFQHTVNTYNIDLPLIQAFFKSMFVDLYQTRHTTETYKEYIYGSAEVVGLMCLKVFCNRNEEQYQQLQPYAQSLGSAFQKVNFLRDIKADYEGLHRVYFPDIDFTNLTYADKLKIEQDIERDFNHAFIGIKLLPKSSRVGVFLAYEYYRLLFFKIRKQPPKNILQMRIRIPNFRKMIIMLRVFVLSKVNLI